MNKKATSISAKKPKSILKSPLTLNVKDFATAVVKGIGHIALGKFDELPSDGADAFSALGIEQNKPEALLFLLLQRSMQSALFSLLNDSKEHLPETIEVESLTRFFELELEHVEISSDFFQRPSQLPAVKNVVKAVEAWLKEEGVKPHISQTIAQRLPGFFPAALHREWQVNGTHYDVIRQNINTPFFQAAERELSWQAYTARLQKVLDIGIFEEPFGLRQIYIPLNAYYEEKITKKRKSNDNQQDEVVHKVVSLQQELDSWLSKFEKDDCTRAISGGPGSGKSSFAKIYASHISTKGLWKVIFCPLHLIDATRDFTDEIGRYVREEEIIKQNPLHPESREEKLLIILDGLDELASQGRAAAATARDFIRAVQQTVDRKNTQEFQLRVIFCGREVVMQESGTEFRGAAQILNVLPYLIDNHSKTKRNILTKKNKYHDPQGLLSNDLRNSWWINYGKLTGLNIKSIPKELERDDLQEITSQPLLNYLLALSYCRGKLDFSTGVNLNQIYYDLVEAVYERGYENGRRHVSIRDLSLDDFFLVLEEIGLAAWHGDGRTTTVSEIEKYCRDGGLGHQLDAFQDGAKIGITRLLAAFFFRQQGERPKGDPTFVFTHKSFGEYLAAKRLVNAMQEIVEERQRRIDKGGSRGWSEEDALHKWAKWSGPTAISSYIQNFLKDEIALINQEDITNWQEHFSSLFSHLLKNGMPMELLRLPRFQEQLFQSRNAEESLLVALNACARVSKKISKISYPSPTSFGAWFKRIQGQRVDAFSTAAFDSLSWLDLKDSKLHISDFIGANLSNSNLEDSFNYRISLQDANLSSANFSRSHLLDALFRNANLKGANLREAHLRGANFREANLEGAKLEGANLQGANLQGANLQGANLEGAKLERAKLEEANLQGASLEGASLEGANLEGANLEGANLEGANLEGANLEGAKLAGTVLEKSNRRQAKLKNTKPAEVELKASDTETI